MAAGSTISFVLAHLPTLLKIIRTAVPMLIELYGVINPRESITREELLERMGERKADANARAEAKAEEIKRRMEGGDSP